MAWLFDNVKQNSEPATVKNSELAPSNLSVFKLVFYFQKPFFYFFRKLVASHETDGIARNRWKSYSSWECQGLTRGPCTTEVSKLNFERIISCNAFIPFVRKKKKKEIYINQFLIIQFLYTYLCRYLQKDKVAGPEGNNVMYELAERALDGEVSQKIKEYISQVHPSKSFASPSPAFFLFFFLMFIII